MTLPKQHDMNAEEKQECPTFIPRGPGIESLIYPWSHFIPTEALTRLTNAEFVVKEIKQLPPRSPTSVLRLGFMPWPSPTGEEGNVYRNGSLQWRQREPSQIQSCRGFI